MRVSKSCNILKPRRTTHRHFAFDNEQSIIIRSKRRGTIQMHRPRSISNKQRQTWISRHSSIHPRETIRIGMDSHRILEIKGGGGVDTGRMEKRTMARSRIREVSLIFRGKNRMGKRRSFSLVLEQFISSGFRARKNEPPPKCNLSQNTGCSTHI